MTESSYKMQMKEMPLDERPRERLQQLGEALLSNAELLAIALRTGTQKENAVGLGQRLLAHFRSLQGLAQASVLELCEVPGIGPAKATQIKAALELGRRLVLASGKELDMVRCPADAERFFRALLAGEMQEQVHVMLLDTKHHVQRIVAVYKGDVNSANVRACEVYREAVRDNSTAIIIAHNHPSGDPAPSPQDIALTSQLVAAGKLLDIELLDHLVIGATGYVSIKELGLAKF